MNMLSSLKALLFSSTAVPAVGGEGGLPASATDGGSLFAAMLADTMGESGAAAESGQVAEAMPMALVVSPEAEAVEPSLNLSVPAIESSVAQPTKPKIADAPEPRTTGNFLPADAAPLPVANDEPTDMAEQAEPEDHEKPQVTAPSWMAMPSPIAPMPINPIAKAAEQAVAEVALPAAAMTHGVPFAGPKLMKSAAPVESIPVSDPVPSSEGAQTEAVPAPQLPVSASAGMTSPTSPQPMGLAEKDPESAPTGRRADRIDKEQRVAEKAADAPPADIASTDGGSKAVAPILNGKPMKSEALALLQIVRDQVGAKQSGASVKVGEAVSAAASSKAKAQSSRTSAEVPSGNAPAVDPAAFPPQSAVTASVQPVPLQTAPVMTAPATDISASLGAEVVDMGVSGQWIDGLARDVAGLSANGAEGRFQIHADKLGTVQVDIRQHADGAAVNLTVANEVAEQALRQDSDRLRLDAGLSAVRIADVKIERSPVAEAARADSPGQQTSQHQSNQHQPSQAQAWQQGNHDMSQSQGQGRWQPRENSAFSPKTGSDPAVLNHADERETGNSAVRARYA